MNNASRFIQGSIFVLFATISITSFGTSELEEKEKEKNTLLEQKKELEQKETPWYKTQKFVTSYVVMPFTVLCSAAVGYYLCNNIDSKINKDSTYSSHKGAGVGVGGCGLIWGVNQINNSYKAKFESDENKKKRVEETLAHVEEAIEKLRNNNSKN